MTELTVLSAMVLAMALAFFTVLDGLRLPSLLDLGAASAAHATHVSGRGASDFSAKFIRVGQ